jgi:hypothetical protein
MTVWFAPCPRKASAKPAAHDIARSAPVAAEACMAVVSLGLSIGKAGAAQRTEGTNGFEVNNVNREQQPLAQRRKRR